MGYPGPVVHGKPVLEPKHLAPGWVGFDFERAFGRPVRVVNDALMQAVGSYQGGRMLFLGLGTGLGSAMIVENVAQPMELAHLPYKDGRTFEQYLGEAALERMGRKAWQKEVVAVVGRLQAALEPEYVVLGGGNVAIARGAAARLPPRRQQERVRRRLSPVGQRCGQGLSEFSASAASARRRRPDNSCCGR